MKFLVYIAYSLVPRPRKALKHWEWDLENAVMPGSIMHNHQARFSSFGIAKQLLLKLIHLCCCFLHISRWVPLH